MGDKGWGLVTAEPIEAGDFLIEYIGRIMHATLLAARLCLDCVVRNLHGCSLQAR